LVITSVNKKFFEKIMTLIKIVVTKLLHAMIINELKVIKLFCELDDFVGEFDKKLCGHSLGSDHPRSFHKPQLTIAEIDVY
jgi:hypothetical protein